MQLCLWSYLQTRQPRKNIVCSGKCGGGLLPASAAWGSGGNKLVVHRPVEGIWFGQFLLTLVKVTIAANCFFFSLVFLFLFYSYSHFYRKVRCCLHCSKVFWKHSSWLKARGSKAWVCVAGKGSLQLQILTTELKEIEHEEGNMKPEAKYCMLVLVTARIEGRPHSKGFRGVRFHAAVRVFVKPKELSNLILVSSNALYHFCTNELETNSPGAVWSVAALLLEHGWQEGFWMEFR